MSSPAQHLRAASAAAARGRRALLAAVLAAGFAPALAAAAPRAATPGAASLFAAATRAADSARTVAVVASERFGGNTEAFDIRLVAGVGGEGTFRQDGSSSEVVRIGARIYTRASAAFWERLADPAAARLFAGRWVEGSATSGWFAGVAADFDMRHLLDEILPEFGTAVAGGRGELAGVPVIELAQGAIGGTLSLEAHGAHEPLEVRSPGLHVRLEAWNAPVALAAPAASVPFASLPARAPVQVHGRPVSLVLPLGWTGAPFPGGLARELAYIAIAPASVGFHANLNLVVTRLSAGESFVRAFLGPADSPLRRRGRLRAVVVGGIRGFEYRSTRLARAEGVALLSEAWIFDRAGTAYQFTYTAPANEGAEYGALFAASAATIRFSPAAAPPPSRPAAAVSCPVCHPWR